MDAPVFPKVREQVEPLIEGLPLVAHNARFDEGCLKAVFKVYQMDYPYYEFYDTCPVTITILCSNSGHSPSTLFPIPLL